MPRASSQKRIDRDVGAGELAPDAAAEEPGGAPAPPAAPPAPPAEAPPFVDIDSAKIGDGSKDARKAAHRTVLKCFGSFLNTETLDDKEGVRTIRVWMREAEKKVKSLPDEVGRGEKTAKGEKGEKGSKGDKGGKGKGKDKGKKGKKGKDKGKGKGSKKGPEEADEDVPAADGAGEFGTLRREGWPKDRPDYLYFRLYKENCNTSEAVSSLARCVGRSAKQFSFAGTKDKRAITVQLICAHKLPLDQLRRTVCHRLWDRRLRISDLEYRLYYDIALAYIILCYIVLL